MPQHMVRGCGIFYFLTLIFNIAEYQNINDICSQS
jgi:hypothetical protein